jgi:hypothetical protein
MHKKEKEIALFCFCITISISFCCVRDPDKLERLLQIKEERQYVLGMEDDRFQEGYKMGL